MKKLLYKFFPFLVIVFSLNSFSQTTIDSLFIHYTLDLEYNREKPFLSLSSLLEYLPGTYHFGIQTPGQSQSLIINGTRNNHSVILIDGLLLHDYLNETPQLSFIPVETIKKIDLYPGLNPFGINSIGGVINITTKKLTAKKPYTKFVYRTGTAYFSDLDVTYGQCIGSKIKILSGVMMKNFGERKSTNQVLPYRKYNAQKTRASIEYTLNNNVKLQYSILSNRHNLRIPFNIPFKKDSSFTPSRKIFRIDHSLKSSLDLHSLQTYLWLYHSSEKINLNEFRFYPQEKTSYLSNQAKLLQSTQILLPIRWGIEYSHCNLTDTSGKKLSYNHNNLFLQVHYPFFRKIKFLTELHYNSSKYTDSALKFSGFMSFSPTNTLHFNIEYDQNSNAPELSQLYGFPIFFNTPLSSNNNKFRKSDLEYKKNFNLQSENSERIQLFCTYNSLQNLHISTSFYYQTCTNLMTINQHYQDNQSTLTYINKLNTKYTGLNSTIFLKIFKNLHLSSSLNLIKSLNKDTLNQVNLPNIQGLTSLSWNHNFFKDDLHATLFASLKYWSEFSLFTLTNEHTFTKQVMMPQVILNVKASFRFNDHTYITISSDNILNQKSSNKYKVFIPHSFIRYEISWELFD